MSKYNDSLAGLCEKLPVAMEDLQGQNYAFNSTTMNGALDFILGPQNNNGAVTAELLSDSRGKLKKARVIYKTSFTTDDVKTGIDAENAGLCDANVDKEPKEVDVAIDDANSMASPLGFTNDKLMLFCEDPTRFMNEYLNNHLAKQREKLDQQILAKIQAGSGINYEEDGTTTAAGVSKGIDILTVDGLPRYQGLDEIIGDYENNKLSGVPAIIGQGKFGKFFRLQNLVCCNSSTPFVQAVQDSGVAYYKDQNANSILGADELLVVAPGSTVFIPFNENKHINLADNPLAKHIVIPDPIYGNSLMWDLDFKWDECEKEWIWFTRVYFTVFNTFQSDSFPSGSPNNEGMTGIFQYKANQASS